MATTDDKSLFNIDFLILQPDQLRYMQEVTSLSIFESNSQVFDKRGFFSTEIFGPIGSKERLERPGYIDIKIPVLHPLVYKYLITLDPIFDKVLASKVRVKLEDGKLVEDSQGSTGYEFFMQNMDKLDFVHNESKRRDDKILLVQRGIQRKNWIQHILVLPAGLRDYVIDKKGTPSSDEVNDYYRKLLISTNVVRNTKITPANYDKFDNYRYKIQNIFLDIFEKFKNYLDGKQGFIQGKWASRAIMGSTRNVLTADMHIVKDLKDKTNGNVINESICGIYQFIKGAPDISMHHINRNFILGVVNPTTNNAKVINSKTLKTEFKAISSKDKSDWITRDGLNNIFNKMKQDVIKDEPAKIGDDYIALVEDKGNVITVIKDTNNIPDGVNASKLRPITYAELCYISVYEVSKEIKAMVTRYPIQQIGSTYPSNIYLATTAPSRRVTVNIDDRSIEMEEYPILGNKYMNSVATNAAHLKRLGAD